MEAKPMKESYTVLNEIVFPADTNYHHTIFGGRVMYYIDKVATIASMRHSRRPVVTASTDSIDFLAPVRLGEAIILEAFVCWTHHTSMEIFVKIHSENLLTGEKKLTATCFTTFIALDEAGRPVPVPPVIPETEEEIRLFNGGQGRYVARKARKRQPLAESGKPV
jgi:acyl-CoA hydrolase